MQNTAQSGIELSNKNKKNFSELFSFFMSGIASSFFSTIRMINYYLIITGTVTHIVIYLIQKFHFSNEIIIDFSKIGPNQVTFLLINFFMIFITKVYDKVFG
ncbi:hypothetical protein GCL60_09845 [Silvanigrella paludirubra]|uniref:Uncharacterized protein n=1 Tax=Silvanigrella paludirubra TaxID=2499159 RepID=A0A6N6VTE4_9BACT|nr:hypothetical protein [Silvanigrella paludirubra]KAB8039148.1 hypothetical protein GCL60_09845 [Silvanigrella paludirubra]